ncbi:MAG: cytochrome c biogenesis protein ResB [Candidatus Omnitrophica bacterium]|nr:cytochrome c biogenesis protein ResB [Candidatus Omnitrophota bacterium]
MFKKIGSLKITLFLLFILAVSSILGTVIAQHQTDDFYMQKYGSVTGRIILVFNGDDFFNSIYYNILLFCLSLNLVVCTVNSFKFVLLKDRRKLAIFILHCGVLVVFAGALSSRFTKQEHRYTLLPGEKVTLHDEGAEVVFKEFSIEYYLQSQIPKEYRSRIEIFEGGIFKSDYVLRVNHPLRYKGFCFYQSSFNVLADVEIEISHRNKILWKGLWEHGKPLDISGKNALRFEMTQFLPDVSVDEQGIIRARSYNLGNAAMLISVYKKDEMVHEQWVFPLDAAMSKENRHPGIFDFEVKKIIPVYATVIQAIKDPGLGFVMSGFALLFSGLILLLFKKKA